MSVEAGHSTVWRFLRTRGWEALPLVYGLALSIREYTRVDGRPLLPDVQGFLIYADRFPTESWWGGFREPIWTTILAGPVAIFGKDEWIPRVLGMISFLALVFVVQYVARRFFGRGWAFLAAISVAASPWFVSYSVSGLREAATAALVVAFGYWVWRGPGSRREWILLGVFVAFMALLRWDTLVLTVPTFAIAAVIRRLDWRTALATVVLAAGIVAPLVVGNAVINDDPFHQSNAAAHFYRNLEFAGQPGFPTQRQFEKDPFRGPPETWLEYVFDRHSFGGVLERFVKAPVFDPIAVAGNAVSYPDPPPITNAPTLDVLNEPRTLLPWLLFAGGVAGGVLLIRRGRWPFALLLLLATLQHFPVIQLPKYELRLEMTVWPLLVLANIESARWLLHWVGHNLGRSPARNSRPIG